MIISPNWLKIESDFSDYYDFLSESSNTTFNYKRYKSMESRAKLLNYLRSLGINTVDVKAVKDFDSLSEYLVVYTDPKLHDCKGKRIIPLEEARIMYGNYLASRFYTESDGYTIKMLQVGSRRFRITLKNNDIFTISKGDIVDISELDPILNYIIQEPIFSIDYVSNGREMLAIDFNKVQNLKDLGMNNIIKPEEVIIEIKKALMAYNKIY